jgi:hypothetical protein
MASKMDKQALWIGWTHDAIARYVMPEDIEDADELADDMVDVVTKYADSMLDEAEKRFEPSARGGKRRKRKDEEEEEDDEDED